MTDVFAFLDRQINDLLRVDVGFSTLPAARRRPVSAETLEGYRTRHGLLTSFQDITERLFTASLKGEADPLIARLIVNEQPDQHGWARHRAVHEQAEQAGRRIRPTFFRTDEVVPGKISEIQCPGSLWCVCEQLDGLYRRFPDRFGGTPPSSLSPAQGFAQDLRAHLHALLGVEPVIHHLLDNASVQAGMRFFLQRTRAHGVKYYGYDKGVTPGDCNFIRAHDFPSLLNENFYRGRFASWMVKELEYDLPPSVVFDEKVPLVLPFWEKTRAQYPDAVRDIFPYTTLVTPDRFQLEDGSRVTLEEFFRLPRGERQYFLKYAGSDISRNWGSKAVYSAAALTRGMIDQLQAEILDGFARNQYWILQKGYSRKETVTYLERDGEAREVEATAKFSGFYGPSGLIAILNMHRPFYKVHGSERTIVSLS
ncbi:hypothetical protein [Desulfonatronum sp. SC1]|uniref:hypothetical protein n=1 Tax=Desulfonatronum sp. SC1 TaxID=2109626 RepID=UPI000D2F8A27|nr:hypothetical protein [Desulfonatronum sp. SC1]PTN39058.1 hypothetical protein C6366_01075 [Desulfonatronum sp. SC1]